MFGVHNSSLVNVKRGVVERIFKVNYGSGLQDPISQTHGDFRLATSEAFRFLRKHAFTLRKLTYEQFIACYDNPQQRARYQASVSSLSVRSVERKDSGIKTFPKAEKTDFSCKADPPPRIISPRDPRYNVAVGVYVKPIEGVLYRLLDQMCGGKTVMKGLNSRQTGEAVAQAWSEFAQPVGIGLDAKRFDQHTRTAALQFEQDIYLLFYRYADQREFRKLLSWQLRSRCRAYCPDGVVKFDMNIRASGDMNTGLGTCLIACALIHSYCTRVGLKYRLLNNGDDCVLICERRDVHMSSGLFDHCKSAGYWMEIEEPVFELEQVEFCQTHPVQTSTGWTMVRNFPHSIGKDMVSLLPLRDEKAWRKWSSDVGNCGMAINSGVPVLYELYACLARAGQGAGSFGSHPWTRNSGFFRMAQGLDRRRTKISDEARLSFWRAFGVTPAVQELLEDQYRTTVPDLCPPCQGQEQQYIINLPTENHQRRPLHHIYDQLLNCFS